MNRAVLYLRLSKEDANKPSKEDTSESIANQRMLLEDYADRNGFEIVDIYTDDDYSGLYSDRPEFERLLRDSRRDKFDIVIAKTQARFTRNMEHMERYLHHDFPLLGIRFVGVVDGVDTAVKSNKKARQINGLTNEWYCEDLSENIRSVFVRKMKDGQFLGGFAPYGYLKDARDKHKFVVDQEAASVVRRIFSLYLEGYSCRAICKQLEDMGVPTPYLHKRRQGLTYQCVHAESFSAKYGLWSTSTVKRILANETYVGKLLQHTQEKVSYKDKRVVPVPKENWIIVEGHHEAIIDKHSFALVQEITHRRRISKSNQDHKRVHILAGKIRCADCGHTMIKAGGVSGGSPEDRYLRCQLSNKSRNKECTSHSIRLSVVEEKVRENIQAAIQRVLEDERNILEIVDFIKKHSDPGSALEEKRAEYNRIEQNIVHIARTVKLLYADRAGGRITDRMFYQLMEDYEKEISGWRKQADRLKEAITELSRQTKDETVYDYVRNYQENICLSHKMINELIDYIEVEEKDKQSGRQRIMIHWNI